MLSGVNGWNPFQDSCWAPRASWSDAKSLVDTEEVEKERFTNDWHRVSNELGTAKLIMRYDDDGSKDADGNGISDEVEDIEKCLWQHHGALLAVFDWYGAIGASGGGGDISFLSLNTWTQFVLDFGLVDKKSKFCKQSDMDTLFITIDGAAGRAQQQHLKEEEEARRTGGHFALGRNASPGVMRGGGTTPTPGKLTHQSTAKFEDKRKMFSRVEFYAAIVAISIKKYVEPKIITDASDAFEHFMANDILPKLKQQQASPTEFRLRHLYTEALDAVLRPKLPTLRVIFEGLVARGKSTGRRHKLLSLQDWIAFIKAAHISGTDATDRDATLCFVWSRMCVTDERTEVAHLREEMLPFEGFLEALCRLSTLKAFPNDAEIAAAGSSCPDAAAYLRGLQLNFADKYHALMADRKGVWGREPLQPVHRCMDHLWSLLTAEFGLNAAAEGNHGEEQELTSEQFHRWAERAMVSGTSSH